ncbi:MAG TPA: YciI family protein [Planctomycetaceae bacterium]|nr:YciI family protein [Planctomycetaceae bacterium]
MLLVYMNEQAMTEAERQQCYTESARLTQDLHATGQYVAAAPLHPVSTATSVRVREGRSLVTDGPFAETREQLGGFYIIEAADLDEALAVAARIPPASKGTIEVRPVMEIPGLPDGDAEGIRSAGRRGAC